MGTALPPHGISSLLVVDDSAVQRNHTVALCRDLGVAQVHEAAGGEEALQVLRALERPPALLVLDLEMPGMDGIELIQALSALGLRIPLVVASSRESTLIHTVEAMARALGQVVVTGLRKPLHPAQLCGAFERHRQMARLVSSHPAGNAPPRIDPADLARAIQQGGIVPHFQPKVDIRTGIVRGVEALARWNHAELGAIPPDQFIPVAEKAGLIHALTHSILDQSLAQAAIWNARGLRLSVAVNLSARLLDAPELVREISALQARHAVPAEQVVLEVTESSVVSTLGEALGSLARLRLRGFGLSIDDYGTGFSSMLQLSRIPFTELKVDRSFVNGAHQRENLRVMLRSALDMARQLGLVSVAEGIESVEDWRLLQSFGCSVGQGYLIARPLPAEAILGWLRHHHVRLHDLREPPSVQTAA